MKAITAISLLVVMTGFCYCTNVNSMAPTTSADRAPGSSDVAENLGTTWMPVALNTDDETVSALLNVKGKRIIAGTSAGIYISDDEGNTWTKGNVNEDDKAAVFSLDMDADGIIYAGLSKYGVLVSTNNGDSWTLYNEGLNKGGPRNSYAMLAADGKVFKGTFESGVYMSADKGKSWNPDNNGIPLDLTTSRMVSVMQLAKNSHAIYALTDLGVRYSEDGGSSWQKPAHNGISRLGYLSSLAVSGNLLFAGSTGGDKGVFVSADNGENWQLSGLKDQAPYALFASPKGELFAGTEGEVYRSIDKGKSWTLAGTGLPAKRYMQSVCRHRAAYLPASRTVAFTC